MVEFLGFELNLRFEYQGRGRRWYDVVLCCTQQEMCELVESCLDELREHWQNEQLSHLEHWALDLCEAIIKGAGQGAIDNMGKDDLVFVLNCADLYTIEELKNQDYDAERRVGEALS